MHIKDIVDSAIAKASADLLKGKLDIRSIIYQAVQGGMADAYARGFAAGQGKTVADAAKVSAAMDEISKEHEALLAGRVN